MEALGRPHLPVSTSTSSTPTSTRDDRDSSLPIKQETTGSIRHWLEPDATTGSFPFRRVLETLACHAKPSSAGRGPVPTLITDPRPGAQLRLHAHDSPVTADRRHSLSGLYVCFCTCSCSLPHQDYPTAGSTTQCRHRLAHPPSIPLAPGSLLHRLATIHHSKPYSLSKAQHVFHR